MDEKTLLETLGKLKAERSDNQRYEAKRAAYRMPENILETISAFSNTPGGGVLILGVDESSGFKAVGVYDPKLCQQALASYAKNEFSSLVEMRVSLVWASGKAVVWAEVREAPRAAKPVKAKRTGKAFLRLYDGDFELSELEEQMFVAARGPSQYDEEPVAGTSASDLDPELTERYLAARRAASVALARLGDSEALIRTGVVASSGELTRAGLAALGVYPQQFMPNYSIRASVRGAGPVRAVNQAVFDGPVPTMLEEAIKWAGRNSNELVLDLPNGRVRNVLEFPPSCVRELVANALIHRDMNPLSMFEAITMTIEGGRLTISNPGGLYGLSVNELGRTGSRARNTRLADLCLHVRDSSGQSAIEKLGSGIPKILEETSALGMPAPLFFDGGIYFTAVLRSAMPQKNVGETANDGSTEGRVLAALAGGPLSRNEIAQAAQITTAQARYALAKLISAEKVTKLGEGRSPGTKYALEMGLG
jgi:ATP-dependent DNA helicase RecG